MLRLPSFLAVALALATPVAVMAKPTVQPALDNEIVYHIFTRSMRDSNGDGDGDLNGIAQSLPYLQKLGVTTILLTPLYPSRVYHNYFADDFEGIDPEYGTMADFRALVAEIHKRKMRILLDMEFQYVSDAHKWWSEARRDPQSPYADYILWDDRAKGLPSLGAFDLRTINNFYNRSFDITTVNLKDPKVKAWADDYLRRWIDPNGDGRFDDGVDGFRLDHMMDNLDGRAGLRDLFTDFWKPRFEKARAINPKITFVAEQWDWGYGTEYLTQADTDAVFAFPIHDAIRKFDKAALVTAIERTDAETPAGKHQFLFAENHDVSRLASDPGMTPERARTAATLIMTLKGTPIIYYGQELGMRGVIDKGYDSDESAIAVREAFEWDATEASKRHAIWYRNPAERYWTNRFSRDNDGISVAEEDRDPASLLNHYRRLTALRRTYPALRSGSQRVLPSAPGLLVVERALGKRRLMIVANLTGEAVVYAPPGRALVKGPGAGLAPWETAVYAVDR